MSSQAEYYNHFAELHTKSILNCPEPELWTTDYAEKGRIYREIKKRVDQQKQLILEFFKKDLPVLDIGCGFGRQAFLLAKNGFTVTGIDTSNVFINIARQLFAGHNYKSRFYCVDILKNELTGRFRQLLLLDVLEHIKPFQRNPFFKQLVKMTNKDSVIILSLPHIKNRLASKLNNRIRRKITQHFSYFLKNEEHPYPIPEKKEILRLSSRNFSLLKFIESAETDYYVFRRN